jgi:hypothetical protein
MSVAQFARYGQADKGESDVDNATWRMARLACGTCCVSDCRTLRAAALAIQQGDELTKAGDDHFVLVECTNPKCSNEQMHATCYERVSEQLQEALGSAWRTGSAKAKQDARTRRAQTGGLPPRMLWKGNTYESQLRSLCRCACNGGFFCVRLDEREEPMRRGLDGGLLNSSSAADVTYAGLKPTAVHDRLVRDGQPMGIGWSAEACNRMLLFC